MHVSIRSGVVSSRTVLQSCMGVSWAAPLGRDKPRARTKTNRVAVPGLWGAQQRSKDTRDRVDPMRRWGHAVSAPTRIPMAAA